MENFFRLLLAKLLLDLQHESSFAETFLSKIFFSNFSKKIFQLSNKKKWLLNRKITFVIVFLRIRYSFLKNLVLALGIKRVIRKNFLP